MADLYGKINRDIVPMTYEGVDTETAETIVDNKNKTIKVNVIGDIGSGSVRYDEVQHLTEQEKEVARNNIGASDIYENLPAEQDGEDFSLVTTGEKYDWDNKQDTLVSQSNIKSVNGNSLLGSGNLDIRTYQEFGNSWVTNGTTQAFCESIRDDINATAGMAYLGKISCSDLPELVQGECVVEIISNDVANGKNIHLILTSAEKSPYRWEYSYCKINGSYTSTDWIGYQTQLISGTSIKTINNNSLLGSGNLNIDALFYCTYGTTTYAEITQALSDGKLPVCIYSNRFYKYDLKSPTDRYIFNTHYSDAIYTLNVQANNTWGAGSTQFEITANKVTSISSDSTDAQYPSAKSVYDYAQQIQPSSISYSTTAPTAANTDGVKIVVLSSEPATRYDGWLYIILGS